MAIGLWWFTAILLALSFAGFLCWLRMAQSKWYYPLMILFGILLGMLLNSFGLTPY